MSPINTCQHQLIISENSVFVNTLEVTVFDSVTKVPKGFFFFII